MSVQAINHINLAVPQPLMQQVRDFYVDVIGLEDRPRGIGAQQGHWLYGGGAALVHLMLPRSGSVADDGSVSATGSGVIDHLAFTCTNLEAMQTSLKQAGVEYRQHDAREVGLVQLFVTDPAGIRVELNFSI